MARNNTILNQALCTVIGAGSTDADHMSGDSIRIIPNGEGSSMETGFDGTVTTLSTDQSGTFEQDFKQTSASIDKYARLWKAQKTAAGSLFNVQIITSAFQSIRLEGCSVNNLGTTGTGGKTASAQTITLNVQKIIYN
ncbi:hypothetical protein D3C85_343810 [compost metagenome]